MSKLNLKIVRAVKNCSLGADDLVALIESCDRRPEPIESLAPEIKTRRRGNYKTREMRAGA